LGARRIRRHRAEIAMSGEPEQAECELDVRLELEAFDANGPTRHDPLDRRRKAPDRRRDHRLDPVEEPHGAPMPPTAACPQACATSLESPALASARGRALHGSAMKRTAALVLLLAAACARPRDRSPATPDAGTVRTTRTGAVVGTAGRYGG